VLEVDLGTASGATSGETRKVVRGWLSQTRAYRYCSLAQDAMKWMQDSEHPDCGAWAFAENSDGDSLRLARAASLKGCYGQGRLGARNTVASRLFQFLCSFL
jgi:hypothetical protein